MFVLMLLALALAVVLVKMPGMFRLGICCLHISIILLIKEAGSGCAWLLLDRFIRNGLKAAWSRPGGSFSCDGGGGGGGACVGLEEVEPVAATTAAVAAAEAAAASRVFMSYELGAAVVLASGLVSSSLGFLLGCSSVSAGRG